MEESQMILREGKYDQDMPPSHFEFNYQPDNFQLWAFKGINDFDNILVTAHTGAGKTAPALYAIKMWLDLNNENQVIYTSPIKTLSNQKFKEFGEHFDNIGILTGDVKINPSGNLLIMTAEILRNSLLRKNNEKVYEWNFNPDKVKCVILDEVHFINNLERGKVWEEIIANLKPDIQLVMLSATISGAENLASWIAKLKNKNCHLIPTPFRPVPLHHYLYFKDDLHCVKDNTSWKDGKWSEVIAGLKKLKKNNKGKKGFNYKQLFDSIQYCKDNDILPVNVFLLNRGLTEQVAKRIPFNLLDKDEISEVEKVWNNYLLKYRDIYETTHQWTFVYSLAVKGIGVHHSGIIPILKEIVEILYESKLIKVLIATETFAMGVNMPTRTVIFTQTKKFDGSGSRCLRPEEYGQMAGRAGRRGLDTFGTVIILPEDDMPNEQDAKKMIMSPPQKISSKLDIDYTFILKRLSLKIDENDETPTLEYLSNSIKDTMLAKEVDFSMKSIVRNLEQHNTSLKDYSEVEEFFEKFIEYKNLESKIEDNRTALIKISNKILKKYESQIKVLEEEIKPKKDTLQEWYKLESEKNNLERQLKTSSVQFENQIKIILNYLIESDIVIFEEDYKLTPLGRIVSEVNECNPLVLGYIISNNYLNQLEFNEIVALLSIFIADKSIEEPYFSDLDISKNFHEILSNIGRFVDAKAVEETEINNELSYNFWSNWDLHLSMFNVTLEWAKGDLKWNQVYHLYDTFEGNFCRNILRLVNLIRNVESIAILIKNHDLINKLEGYQEKLVRDIVLNDSLYL